MGNRTLLIVGASSDIGLEYIATAHPNYDQIIAHCNSNEEDLKALLKAKKVKSEVFQSDLSTADGASRLVAKLGELERRPTHILFLAAPRLRFRRFKELEWADVEREMNVQLRSSFELLQHCLPDMVRSKFGRIVFVLSSVTVGAAPIALAHYVIAKEAVHGMARAIASEYASKGITVNAISPSMIETKFLEEIDSRFTEAAAGQHPLKRNARPADLLPVLNALLAEEAGYVNGVNIPITGGSVL